MQEHVAPYFRLQNVKSQENTKNTTHLWRVAEPNNSLCAQIYARILLRVFKNTA